MRVHCKFHFPTVLFSTVLLHHTLRRLLGWPSGASRWGKCRLSFWGLPSSVTNFQNALHHVCFLHWRVIPFTVSLRSMIEEVGLFCRSTWRSASCGGGYCLVTEATCRPTVAFDTYGRHPAHEPTRNTQNAFSTRLLLLKFLPPIAVNPNHKPVQKRWLWDPAGW